MSEARMDWIEALLSKWSAERVRLAGAVTSGYSRRVQELIDGSPLALLYEACPGFEPHEEDLALFHLRARSRVEACRISGFGDVLVFGSYLLESASFAMSAGYGTVLTLSGTAFVKVAAPSVPEFFRELVAQGDPPGI